MKDTSKIPPTRLDGPLVSVESPIIIFTDDIIPLQSDCTIYKNKPTAEISYKIDFSNLITDEDYVWTFELLVDLSDGIVNIEFTDIPNLTWIYNTEPIITEPMKYLFSFRSFDDGINWIGCLQGRF